MYEFYIEYIHWFDHAAEAFVLLMMIGVLIVLYNVLFDNQLFEDVEWALRNPVNTIIIHTVIFIVLMIVSHYIVKRTHVDLWNHGHVQEERRVNYPEESVRQILTLDS